MTSARLRIPSSLLAYIAIFPALAIALAVGRQWGPAVMSAMLAGLAWLTIRTIDALTTDRLKREVREGTLGALRAGAPHRVEAVFASLPAAAEGVGYLYAVEFATGVVKVGKTIEPRTRLRSHQRDGEAFSVGVVDVWLSPAHTNFAGTEQQLIRACAAISERSKSEYFRGLDCARVARIAASLPMKVVTA